MSAKQTAETFWARVDKTGDCWLWTGAKNNTGYGTVAWDGVVYTAHRLAAYLTGLVTSPVAPKHGSSTFVLHRCDTRLCCNPAHFELGTYAKNQLDAYARKQRKQPKGEHHSNAKLTNEQAAQIRTLYKTGSYRQVDLADTFGVSQRVISLIVRGETYGYCNN